MKNANTFASLNALKALAGAEPPAAARAAGIETDLPVELSKEVFFFLKNTLGKRQPEVGALLGSSNGGRTVDTFALDHTAHTGGAVYVPNVDYCNKVLSQWDDAGILMAGIAHSHPDGCTVPSGPDLSAAAAYIQAVPGLGGKMEMPIIQAESSSGGFRIFWYTAYLVREGVARVVRRQVTVEGQRVDAGQASYRERTLVVPEGEMFQRKESVFPTQVSRRKELVVIGNGGAGPFMEMAARLALGGILCIDGDKVEAANVATQGARVDQIGQNKTHALAKELKRIDPYCRVRTCSRMLDDSITDEDFARMVGPVLLERPTDVVICGFTDSFEANARAAALATKFGTAYLQGLVYQHGTVAEVVFSYPGVTPACPRCCLTSRWDAYAAGTVQKVENVSTGCPISATAILNAYKLEVLQELLFWNEEGPYKDRLAGHAETNLLMVRLGEEIPSVLEGSAFDKATRHPVTGAAITGAAFWDAITPDGPRNGAKPCPLCGGTGDLRNAIGQPADTRRVA